MIATISEVCTWFCSAHDSSGGSKVRMPFAVTESLFPSKYHFLPFGLLQGGSNQWIFPSFFFFYLYLFSLHFQISFSLTHMMAHPLLVCLIWPYLPYCFYAFGLSLALKSRYFWNWASTLLKNGLLHSVGQACQTQWPTGMRHAAPGQEFDMFGVGLSQIQFD